MLIDVEVAVMLPHPLDLMYGLKPFFLAFFLVAFYNSDATIVLDIMALSKWLVKKSDTYVVVIEAVMLPHPLDELGLKPFFSCSNACEILVLKYVER